MCCGGKRRRAGWDGLWQGGLRRDDQRWWGGTERDGAQWNEAGGSESSVGRREWDGTKRNRTERNGTERNGMGRDGKGRGEAKRNKAGRASGAGGVEQTARERGEAAT